LGGVSISGISNLNHDNVTKIAIMSDNPITTPPLPIIEEAVAPEEQQPKKKKRRGRRKAEPKVIHLPGGEEAWPRPMFAADLGVCEATIRRMNLPNFLFGGIVHVLRNAALRQIAARARSRSPR
jgi:hypothetical protein